MATIPGTSGNDTLSGTSANDTFLLQTGGSGDNNGLDQYYGGDGHDRILGGWSYDVLRVTNNLSNLNSIEEIDAGDGTSGYNTILATDGNDTLDFSGYTVKNFIIDGGKGRDNITGTSGNDHIRGGEGNDTVSGGDGDDTFYLNTGGDINGTDQYDGGDGVDRIVGGWSYDVLRVTNHLANLTGIEQIDGGDGTLGYNTIVGTAGHDTLDFSGMTVTRFIIDGLGGNDVITGTSGNDHIRGEAGNDAMNGGDGSDTYYVGAGHGADSFNDTGTSGTDRIVATANNVAIGISSLSGIEEIDGNGKSNVTVTGTANHDTLNFAGVALTDIKLVDGLGGNDTITTSNLSAMTYRGGTGNDSFTLGSQNTTLLYSGDAAANGADSFSGNVIGDGVQHTIKAEANGTVIGLSGAFINGVDTIDATGFGNVVVRAATGQHNTLDFSGVELKNIKEIDGDNGNDTITTSNVTAMTYRGGVGNDSFTLGSKSTTLLYSGDAAANGADSFSGNVIGDGVQHVIKAEADGTVIGLSGAFDNGVDKIDTNGFSNVVVRAATGQHNNLNFSGVDLTNIVEIDGDNGNDTIATSNVTAMSYRGGAGNDSFVLGSKNTTLLYSGDAAANGADAFSGNVIGDGVQHVIKAEANGTVIGLSGSFSSGVDRIDADGHSNVVVQAATGQHNNLDFSGVVMVGITTVDAGNGNDTVTTSEASAGPIDYRGGVGTDTLRVALTADQLGNATLVSQIAGFTPGGGLNLSVNAGGLNFTAHEFEALKLSAVVNGALLEDLNVLTGTANHDNGTHAPALNVAGLFPAKVNQAWAIFGRGGDDVITGGNAGDLILGEGGSDNLFGGNGNDVFLVTASTPADGFDRFDGGSGHDTILSAGNGIAIRVNTLAGIEEIGSGGFSGVKVIGNNAAHVTLDLSGTKLVGIEEVYAGTANNTIHTSNETAGQAYRGGKGNDTFHFGSKDATLLASSADNGGFDSFNNNTAGATHSIIAEDDNTEIGIAGTYGSTQSVDVIDGGGHTGVKIVGSNSVHNNWNFTDTQLNGIAEIRGGDNTANDIIVGSKGDDRIFGLGGNDRLAGGEGNDVLYGGPGNDRFVFAPGDGEDRVEDFNTGDRIDLTAYVTNFSAIEDDITVVGGNSVIDLSGGDQVTVVGVTSLGASDFIF